MRDFNATREKEYKKFGKSKIDYRTLNNSRRFCYTPLFFLLFPTLSLRYPLLLLSLSHFFFSLIFKTRLALNSLTVSGSCNMKISLPLCFMRTYVWKEKPFYFSINKFEWSWGKKLIFLFIICIPWKKDCAKFFWRGVTFFRKIIIFIISSNFWLEIFSIRPKECDRPISNSEVNFENFQKRRNLFIFIKRYSRVELHNFDEKCDICDATFPQFINKFVIISGHYL